MSKANKCSCGASLKQPLVNRKNNRNDVCTCVCGAVSNSNSFIFESGITDDEYKQFLFDSLSSGPDGNCLPDDFFEMICNYWQIYRNLGCGSNDLRYLYVRSAAITSLMGCAIFDVTYRISNSESNTKTVSKSKSDSQSQGQSTSHSASYNESVFESGYSDFANSLLRAESQRTAQSDSHDQSRTVTDDIGSGASSSETDGERDSRSDRTSQDESESHGQGSSSGSRRGSDYSFTHDNTDSNVGFAIVGGVSRRGTKGANLRLMTTDSYNSAQSTRDGFSTKELNAEAYSQSWSQRLSSSHFQALLDSNTNATSNAVAFDYSRSQSDAESHSAGKGQSAAESEARSTASNQRTSESDSLSTNETDGTGNSYSISEYRANSQKFDHLAVLLRNTNDAITELVNRRAALVGVAIGPMLMANPDGYCNLDTIRSKIRYPGGVNGINCRPTMPRRIISHELQSR